MTKELRMEVLSLMLGMSEKVFVENCVRILAGHHLKRVAANLSRMDVKRASKRIQAMLEPTEKELALA